MPAFCGILGCGNKKSKFPEKSFYRLPAVDKRYGGRREKITRERRLKWLTNISRADITEAGKKHLVVCSDHFLSGRPAHREATTDPDWAPTQNLGHKKVSQGKMAISYARQQRVQERNDKKEIIMAAEALMDIQQSAHPFVEEDQVLSRSVACQTELPTLASVSCQTDATLVEMEKFDKHNEDVNKLQKEIFELRSRVRGVGYVNLNLDNDDEKVLFYTGLPNYAVLMCIFNFVSLSVAPSSKSKLSLFDEFLLFLIHLRLNTCFRDLAYRFNLSIPTVSRLFYKWLDIAHTNLRNNIVWPAREELRLAMPACFRKNFGDRVSVILDCFEVPLATPSSLMAKAATWSNYKHNNTMKFLIGIAPSGCISFISRGWGGRVSDKNITEQCGILSNLLPGDIVLADRGFAIAESVGLYCASLSIPAFTRGKAQLSAFEVENTRKIANVRIHRESYWVGSS